MQLHLHRARRVVQLALSVLVLALAARFAWTAHAQWEAAQQAPVPVAPKPKIAPEPPPPKPVVPPSEPEPVGALVRIVLSVSHGQRRSEVLLDGMHLGHTTYAGDVSCRLGTNVTVRILPAHGAPIDHVMPCDGRMIIVREP